MTQFNHVWLLDFDRTISSVDVVSRMVAHVCEELKLDYSLLEREHARTEARGESFVVTELFKQLWPEYYAQFQHKLHEIDQLESVFPDAATFLARLEGQGDQFAIITFGDREWQTMKLQFSGLIDKPHIICDSPHKADLIRTWQHDTMFRLPLEDGTYVEANHLTLVDDKAVAFDGLPDMVQGFCIDRRHIVQPGDVPEHVPIVGTFDDIQKIIEKD